MLISTQKLANVQLNSEWMKNKNTLLFAYKIQALSENAAEILGFAAKLSQLVRE